MLSDYINTATLCVGGKFPPNRNPAEPDQPAVDHCRYFIQKTQDRVDVPDIYSATEIRRKHEKSWSNHQVSELTVKVCMLKNVCKKSAKVKYGELFFMLTSNRQTSINLPCSTLLPHLNLFIINIDYLKPGVATKGTLFRQKDQKTVSFQDDQQTRMNAA